MKKNLILLGSGFLAGAGVMTLVCSTLIFSCASSADTSVAAPVSVPSAGTLSSPAPAPAEPSAALPPRLVSQPSQSDSGESAAAVPAETLPAGVDPAPLAPEVVAERRARFLEMVRERRAAELEADRERCDFLTSVDPALLTEEQTGSHQAYAQLAVRCGEIRELLADQAGELSAEERAALQREFRETQQELAVHAVTERQALFEAVARAMGLEGEEPAAFAETMFQVISVTEPPRNPTHRRPGRRR